MKSTSTLKKLQYRKLIECFGTASLKFCRVIERLFLFFSLVFLVPRVENICIHSLGFQIELFESIFFYDQEVDYTGRFVSLSA